MKEKHQKQRDYMRYLYQKFNKDSLKIIKAYSAAEMAGRVIRKKNSYDLTPEQYAKRLFLDGIRKGWIKK